MTLIGRLILVLSSLAPTALGLAINEYTKGTPWSCGFWLCVSAAILFAVSAYGLTKTISGKVQKTEITLSQVTRNPKDTLAFMVAYLYPVTSDKAILSTLSWGATAYVALIVVLVLLQSRAFHINPVIALLGYQAFDAKDADGYSLVVFVKGEPPKLKEEIKISRLSPDVVFFQSTTTK